jgi:hypothetical protein
VQKERVSNTLYGSMIYKNKTAYDYADSKFKAQPFIPIRINSTGVAGNSAWSVDFMLGSNTFFREIYMVNNGKLYELMYMAPRLKVPSTLPIAQKMFDSFELIKK